MDSRLLKVMYTMLKQHKTASQMYLESNLCYYLPVYLET